MITFAVYFDLGVTGDSLEIDVTTVKTLPSPTKWWYAQLCKIYTSYNRIYTIYMYNMCSLEIDIATVRTLLLPFNIRFLANVDKFHIVLPNIKFLPKVNKYEFCCQGWEHNEQDVEHSGHPICLHRPLEVQLILIMYLDTLSEWTIVYTYCLYSITGTCSF